MHPFMAALSPPRLRFTGTFSTTSASSPVTSSTRTINLPGTLVFDSPGGTFPSSGSYSKNGGAFTSITAGLTLAMAGGDTLAIRLTSALAGTFTVSLRNNLTLAMIEAITMTKT
jgi:hypothetical protein